MGNKETKIKDSCTKVERQRYANYNESLAAPKTQFVNHKTNGYTLSQASSDKKPDTKKR